jgi:hypothetical protein
VTRLLSFVSIIPGFRLPEFELLIAAGFRTGRHRSNSKCDQSVALSLSTKTSSAWRMLGLVGAIDKPISVKIVPSRSYLMDIAGNLYGGVSHGWHFQFRHSFRALERKRRRKTDLISIKMLWCHVWIVYRHSEKNSFRENILGFGPFDHGLKGGKYSIQFEGIRNPEYRRLAFREYRSISLERQLSFLPRSWGDHIRLAGTVLCISCSF